MGGETLMPERFTLNEPAAGRWLHRAPRPGTEWDLEDYQPTADNALTTETLVHNAQDSDIITGPAGTRLGRHSAAGDDDKGETVWWWIVTIEVPGDHPDLRIIGAYEDYPEDHDLDDMPAGPAAALQVLRDAVAAGNLMLDAIDAHQAGRS
jgi:hypothetical protein